MRILSLAFATLIFVLAIQGQDKVNQTPNQLLGRSVVELLRPDKADKEEAKRLGFSVFRILPREVYDGKIDINGGGAYYSFARGAASNDLDPYDYVRVPTPVSELGYRGSASPVVAAVPQRATNVVTGSGFKMEENQMSTLPINSPHSYGFGSDLEFQRGNFSVGFAGADYGFLYDLGDTSLDKISLETSEVKFLSSYTPPRKIAEVRAEQSKLFHTDAYEANGFAYKRSLPAVVGHTYILRSLNFRTSDVLVAFRVYRQDKDGSLIIFWKKMKTFGTPPLEGRD